MSRPHSYDPIARYYDQAHGEIEEDIGMMQTFAQETGGPILEVGVGTGRVALPLAQAGYDVVGVDSSQEMLEMAARRQQGMSLDNRVKWVQADFRDFELDSRFPLIYCAYNTFLHLIDEQDQLNALRCWRRHLQPDGHLVLDVENPELFAITEADGSIELSASYEDEETGNLVHVLRSGWADFADQVIKMNIFYDEVDAEGVVRRIATTFPMRILFRRELSLLLRMAGFERLNFFGDHQLSPWQSDSPRLIVAARPTKR